MEHYEDLIFQGDFTGRANNFNQETTRPKRETKASIKKTKTKPETQTHKKTTDPRRHRK